MTLGKKTGVKEQGETNAKYLDEAEQHQQRRDEAVALEGRSGEGFPEEGVCGQDNKQRYYRPPL